MHENLTFITVTKSAKDYKVPLNVKYKVHAYKPILSQMVSIQKIITNVSANSKLLKLKWFLKEVCTTDFNKVIQ